MKRIVVSFSLVRLGHAFRTPLPERRTAPGEIDTARKKIFQPLKSLKFLFSGLRQGSRPA
jgi:hypothetical protein